MKTALITTTINIPKVLALYRKFDPDVKFYIAGDQKTDHLSVQGLCETLGNAFYLNPEQQNVWETSKYLGWNTITRRNIALLEALRWGADIIVTIDDDNIPLDETYFSTFWEEHSGFEASGPNNWLDTGQFLIPHIPQRGFPPIKACVPFIDSVVGAKIGVWAGAVLGDSDMDATTRIARHPIAHQASELITNGLSVAHYTYAPFNTQNTAFVRELAPAMLCCRQFGRFDDIFASLICQRVMREFDLHVRFGPPFVWQQRNPHDLVKDLKAEVWGMENIIDLVTTLEALTDLPPATIPAVDSIYYNLIDMWEMPDMKPLIQAWLQDCQKAMA